MLDEVEDVAGEVEPTAEVGVADGEVEGVTVAEATGEPGSELDTVGVDELACEAVTETIAAVPVGELDIATEPEGDCEDDAVAEIVTVVEGSGTRELVGSRIDVDGVALAERDAVEETKIDHDGLALAVERGFEDVEPPEPDIVGL